MKFILKLKGVELLTKKKQKGIYAGLHQDECPTEGGPCLGTYSTIPCLGGVVALVCVNGVWTDAQCSLPGFPC